MAKPAKTIPPCKKSPVEEEPIEEEEQLSSRETTPPQSPGPVFEQPKDYTEDNIDAADLEQTEDEDETVEQSASDDELCGPKTPMRRTQNAQSQVHISSRSNAKRQDPDVPLHTPPRRRGARGGTPQTQKQYDQTVTTESAVRPMTVARANDRAFVFRKLQDDTTPGADVTATTNAEDEDASEGEKLAEVTEEHDQGEDVSSALEPEEDDSEHAGDDDCHDPEETIVLNEHTLDERQDFELVNSPTVEPPKFTYDDAENTANGASSPIELPIVEETMDHDDSSMIEPPVAEYDDDDEMNMDSPTVEPPVASYEVDLDGSVIIHSRGGSDSEEDSEDEEDEMTQFGLKTPRPETIPWQNIREDSTIPIDFDLHFADVRTPARVDDEFSYDAASMFQNLQADQSLQPDQHFEQLTEEPTMNLNDFVDIAALTEPTVQLDTMAGAVNEGSRAVSDDESSLSHMDDTEDTVIITKTQSPVLSAVELSTGQRESCDDTPSCDNNRSGMMRESLQQLTVMNGQAELDTTTPAYGTDDALEEVDECVPHYALPTLSSRRKSLPALGNQTPVRSDARPTTSDGSSIARVANPFDQSWWARSRRSSVAGGDSLATPVRSASTRRPSSAKRSTAFIEQNSHAATKTPMTQTGERFPRRAPKDRYEGQFEAQTVAAPSRFHTPGQVPVRYPATVQKLASQQAQQAPLKGQPGVSTANSARTSSQADESEHAQSFDVPLRFRTPSSITAQRTPTRVSEGSLETADHESHATPQERFPRRSARQTYGQQPSTAAPPARFHTPIQGKPRRPATVQRLASQPTSHAESSARHVTPTQTPRGSRSKATPSVTTPSVTTPSADTPQARFPRLPPTDAYEAHVSAETQPLPATPQARFPRLPPKHTYDERAGTVHAGSRFRSPARPSPRRPATAQKPVNLRKIALKSAAPEYGSHTPIKTPLKAPAETPSQVPMTPHPGAPLRGVLALVEVFTLDGSSASAPFISLLQRLGARTTKTWSERVTHVIFKDGSPTTLQRVRLNNKEVEKTCKGFIIHCVNSRWVSDCDASGSRVDEDDDAYSVDVTEVPRGGNRRRKSMEPSALINVGGNIVRDRKSSGRQSIGRSTMKPDSSDKRFENDIEFTPVAKWEALPDEDDFEDDESELSTPDYLAAPDKLVQMTAPMNRVRKLDLQKDAGKNRRMTSFWEGGD